MIEPRSITADDVQSGIRRLATDRPGVYARRDDSGAGCVNTEFVDGEYVASCIVGSFFVTILGVDAEEVPETGGYRSLLRHFVKLGWSFSEEAVMLLGIAQKMQDTREISWRSISGCMEAIEDVLGDGGQGFTQDD